VKDVCFLNENISEETGEGRSFSSHRRAQERLRDKHDTRMVRHEAYDDEPERAHVLTSTEDFRIQHFCAGGLN
jgi:hypothetical protein